MNTQQEIVVVQDMYAPYAAGRDRGFAGQGGGNVMKLFHVFYFDIIVGTISAPTRTDAIKQMGVRWGGQVGIRLGIGFVVGGC
jgi:hypothetical protein